MKFHHVALIIGTRPEAIKLAPVALAMRSMPERFRCTIVGTGQQREMLPQTLAEFGLKVDVNLAVMRDNQSLSGLTARLLDALDPLMAEVRPDWILVQGDTTTAMVGSLIAFYHRIRLSHVEAGLRTFDRFAPYPEEVNRRVITSTADLHFAATEAGRRNLLSEGICACHIHVVGNTGIDALLWTRDQLDKKSTGLPERITAALTNRRLIMVTSHRRENFDNGIKNICLAIREIVNSSPDVVVVYPVHFNPNVREPVQYFLCGHDRIILIDPLSYRFFVELMSRAMFIMTDSGGIQEEAPSLGKPVIVMRETTERPEGVEAGNAVLVGTDRATVVSTATRLLNDRLFYGTMAQVKNPYGDGHATGRILDVLTSHN